MQINVLIQSSLLCSFLHFVHVLLRAIETDNILSIVLSFVSSSPSSAENGDRYKSMYADVPATARVHCETLQKRMFDPAEDDYVRE